MTIAKKTAIKTLAADISFINFILGFCRGSIKSAKNSMAVFNSSVINTRIIELITTTHSISLIEKKNDKNMINIVA